MKESLISGIVVATAVPVVPANYDEANVPQYKLPPLLQCADGRLVRNASEWMLMRRPEVLAQFKHEMYGEMPPRPDRMRFEVLSVKNDALNDTAIRKEIRVHLAMENGKEHYFDLLLYFPRDAKKPVPAFLGLNFKGNHVASPEPDVRITGLNGIDKNSPQSEPRGNQTERWHFAELIRKGYAAATVCYHDIFPDRADGWGQSIYQLFGNCDGMSGTHDTYSAIGAWAWGLSRALDALENEPMIDATRVAVHGHSRLGKTALWAGANDPRFAMVVSNNSGCCGAALSKRCFGETVEVITRQFPHWFIAGLQPYRNNEQALSFDQHMLLSLIAPRPLAVASATEDLWADPRGEFHSAVYTGEVYCLLGDTQLKADEMPKPDEYQTGIVSYHLRTGKHEQTTFDWNHYTAIADQFIKQQEK